MGQTRETVRGSVQVERARNNQAEHWSWSGSKEKWKKQASDEKRSSRTLKWSGTQERKKKQEVERRQRSRARGGDASKPTAEAEDKQQPLQAQPFLSPEEVLEKPRSDDGVFYRKGHGRHNGKATRTTIPYMNNYETLHKCMYEHF